MWWKCELTKGEIETHACRWIVLVALVELRSIVQEREVSKEGNGF
jgi:hypothetical protein